MSFSMFTKLLTSNRSVQGSGYNLEGQLDNDKGNYELNIENINIRNVSVMDMSVYHTIYILKSGIVKGVGHNGYGQLGIGNIENQITPVDIPITDVEQVACGGYHTVYLKRNGEVYVTGYNEHGELGLGHNNSVSTLTKLNLSDVEQVACGGYHTFFIMKDGSVKACGYNRYGELGLGHNNQVLTPVTVPLINIKEIFCGGSYTFFRMTDATIKACGYNGYGQLGLGDELDRNSPVDVPITQVSTITCSAHHTLFLKYDKTVYGCGHNEYGQLGLGNWESTSSIVKLPIDNVSNIFANSYSSFFLISGKDVYGCGHNGYGELALGDSVNRNTITKLKYTNLWDTEYSDTIVILPPFDKSKKLFVADGYFMGYTSEYCMILDKDLVLRIYSRDGMIPVDVYYFYIYERKINFTKDELSVFNPDGTRKYNIDPIYSTCDNNCEGSDFFFSINNVVFKYNTLTNTITEETIRGSLCTSINDKLFFFDSEVMLKDLNGKLNITSSDSRIRGIEQCINIEIENYTKFFYKDEKGYFSDDTLSNIKEVNFEDKINTCLFSSGKRIFIGTKSGFVFSFKDIEDIDSKHIYKKYDHEISFIKIKENNNALDKTLLIDEHGSYLIVGFTDGGYIKDPLYLMPEVSITCNDINFIDGKAYYHTNIRLLNDSIFYDNLQFLVHNKYNEETFDYAELNKKGSLNKLLAFNTHDLGIFSYLRLNYLFGNNSLGTIYTEVCNIKINMLYSYLDKLFLNVSNYSNNPCNLILERINEDGTKDEIETIILDNQVDNNFISFNPLPNMISFNLKLQQDSTEYYIKENIIVKDIELTNSIKNYNFEGDILNDFSTLFNKIYENKNLSDISLEFIVRMLNQLSHKKIDKTENLDSLLLEKGTKNDIFGNTINFLTGYDDKYIIPFNPENIYKDMRYRSNIFINGRKIPFNDVYNLLNTGSSQMVSYFKDRSIEKSVNNYVNANIYEESLILNESELHKIYIRDWKSADKLLKGEYLFTVNLSEYIDVNRMSLYVKFRHGSYQNRINLNNYNLEMYEVTNSYVTFKLYIRDQVLCQIGNEICITLNDLTKGTNVIFKDFTKNNSKKYKNYFVPLLSLNENGSITNYYIDKSEHIEVFVNGYTMIPYVDYKIMNFPLHLQLPSLILFKNPVKNDVKIEISIMKENYIDCIVKKKDDENFIISDVDDNLDSTFIPLIYNTYDKFIDNIKIPNLEEDGRTVKVYSDNFKDRQYEYIKFYLEDNQLIRFLITMLRLKLKTENIVKPNNIGSITTDIFNPDKPSYNIYEDESTDGLLYFIIEEFDKSIVNNKDVVIDCNDELKIKMLDRDVVLDSNKNFDIPYIERDILINCNFDYNSQDYFNKIL